MGFDDRVLLARVGLTLNAGDCVILKGDNGAGKTTLMRGLAGLAPLITGTVLVGGIDRDHDRVGAARRLVYIGHRDGLAAELTAGEAIRLWAAARGLTPSDDQLSTAFAAVAMQAVINQPVRTLSAGQKRRSAMARLALLTGMETTATTPLWLLDEPTTAMDAGATRHFADLIEAHIAAGGAALITTHLDLPIAGARIVTIDALEQADG